MLWNGNKRGKIQGNENLKATIPKYQKQLKNVEYFNYLGRMITNDARCTR